MNNVQKEDQSPKIDPTLVKNEYAKYQHAPQTYLLEVVVASNPWPQRNQADILAFLKSISRSYNKIPYHNLTHAFDVMVNLDSYLTQCGWQELLGITAFERTVMLLAAYAHDSGHEGFTNPFYLNSKHQWAEQSKSPLENMHASNLLQLMNKHGFQPTQAQKQLIVELILKTDNKYHHELTTQLDKMKEKSPLAMKGTEDGLMLRCALLHASDLNNASKQTQRSIKWVKLLYQEFENQAQVEEKRGLPLSGLRRGSDLQYAQNNMWFIDHMVLPLFRSIDALSHSLSGVISQIKVNRDYWEEQMRALE